MNKKTTFLGLATIAMLGGSYFFMDNNSADHSQDISKAPETMVHKHSAELASLDENALATRSTTSEQSTEAGAEPAHIVRHYSNTFQSTAEYESASKFGRLPPHLSDVRLIELPFDDQGQLIIDDKVKQIIEFFLLAQSDEGLDQAIERLYEYFEMTLPEPAKEQAKALAQQYLAYKEQLDTPQFSDNTNLGDEASLADIKLALDERKKLRRELLGEENTEAIFDYEERYEDFSFARLQINANRNLSDEEKDQQIAQAELNLPAGLAEKVRYKRESKNIEHKIAELKQSAGNEAEIFELRKQFYGEKAAERFAYVEDQSPVWQQRVNEFYLQQARIKNDDLLTYEEKKQKIRALKDQSFTYKEQVKLAVQQISG